MSFREWRQQCRLLHALELRKAGAASALEAAYDNGSGLGTMFRRCLGATPRQYLNRGTRSTG